MQHALLANPSYAHIDLQVKSVSATQFQYAHSHTVCHTQLISLETELDIIFSDERYHFSIENGVSIWNLLPQAGPNIPTQRTYLIGVSSKGEPTMATITKETWQRVHVKTVARLAHLSQRNPSPGSSPGEGHNN